MKIIIHAEVFDITAQTKKPRFVPRIDKYFEKAQEKITPTTKKLQNEKQRTNPYAH